MARRQCQGKKANGDACRTHPLVDGDWCLMHDPDKQEEADEARRLGGVRRRRERVVQGAYDYEGLGTIEGIRRVLDIAVADTLGLENGVQRSRTLIAGAQAAAKLLETGELADRIEALEEVLADRKDKHGGGKRR
jgi:hypothetical protein